MTKENLEKIINLLRKNREKTIQVLLNLLRDTNMRIKVPNELLEKLFIQKQKIEVDKKSNKSKYISKFITDSKTKELYKYFDFSDFKYKDLHIETKGFNESTLDIMRDNHITFYPQNIYNKELTYCELKGINIDGNFSGWNIEGSNFSGCIGYPEINPEKLSNKSLHGVNLKNAIVVGKCNNVDVTGASFKGAIVNNDFYLNPQRVKGKSLVGTKLSGVRIKGSFDGINIFNTDFSGCETDLVLDLDKLNLDSKNELKYNNFNGITLTGDLSNYKLDSNNFTGSKNAVIDFNTNSHIQISSSNNIFADVEFKNMHKASEHFLFGNNNNFTNSYIIYDAYNSQRELAWYNKIMADKEYRHFIENIKLVNEDELLENEIMGIIEPEIEKQKKKTKKSK